MKQPVLSASIGSAQWALKGQLNLFVELVQDQESKEGRLER